ncbi:inovirus-type Gp2 protein [Aeromonas dhakensis]|uniref:inovirus-type Gp2 protein n=1 Tax=Aeromonas dhakensis TaxID=196024 RepID=UPI000F540671|nr:inovirus-type Gp2 protein [Aeromonas dhakensis]RQM79957.1 inovirus Gp2 family protein [Aeromonas dhakensis]
MTDEIDVIAKEERRKVDKGETEEILKKFSIYEYSDSLLKAAKRNRTYAHIAATISRGFMLKTSEIDDYRLRFIKSLGVNRRHYLKKSRVVSGDADFFERIFMLLRYIGTIREYSYYHLPMIGRRIFEISNLEDEQSVNKAFELIKDRMASQKDLLPVYSAVQKKEIRKILRKLISSNINAFISDEDFERHFNVHPAVPYFIKAIKFHRLSIGCDTDFNEYYSDDVIGGLVSFINVVFDSNSYKESVRLRAFNVEQNIKSIFGYVKEKEEGNARYVVRFSLGFKQKIENMYAKDNDIHIESSNVATQPETKGLDKEPLKIASQTEGFKDKLEELVEGRRKLFINCSRNRLFRHVDGYIWKLDYCSVRGYYMHVFLFLGRGWEHKLDIRETIGQLWKSTIIKDGEGDVFAYPGDRYEFNLMDGGNSSHALYEELESLFRQDILAHVDTILPNGKKARSFGKGAQRKPVRNRSKYKF